MSSACRRFQFVFSEKKQQQFAYREETQLADKAMQQISIIVTVICAATCVSRAVDRSNETDQAVNSQQDEVDTDDDRVIGVDDGACDRVVVTEQIRQQALLVRRVTELVLR